MDKSKICVNRTINLAKQKPCKQTTNLLVYDKTKTVKDLCPRCPPPPRKFIANELPTEVDI